MSTAADISSHADSAKERHEEESSANDRHDDVSAANSNAAIDSPNGSNEAASEAQENPMEEASTTPTPGPLHDEIQSLEDRFIENWGDISALWGVSKSIGRIHALLFVVQQPLSMEEVAQRLQISHGNASTSIRDLLAWGVIHKSHKPGERKTYYEAEQDPWTWFHTCIRERRRREVLPVFDRLGEVRKDARDLAAAHDDPDVNHANERIETFTNFMDEFLALIDAFLAMGHGPLGKAMLTMAKLMPKGREAKGK